MASRSEDSMPQAENKQKMFNKKHWLDWNAINNQKSTHVGEYSQIVEHAVARYIKLKQKMSSKKHWLDFDAIIKLTSTHIGEQSQCHWTRDSPSYKKVRTIKKGRVF